jgi:mannose-6-phosphate isomerase
MHYPFQFQPIFKTYLWGGRHLDTLFHKPVPPTGPVAESWEIVDRADDNSVVANGPLAGKTLRWLMANHQRELLGRAPSWKGRFPLLVKILDALESLSLQVHPSNETAAKFGGEPKTEMWHLVHTDPGASLAVGLKRGVTKAQFAAALKDGTVEKCVHQVAVKSGDTMFVPGGRLHAIGAGCTLYEIQQNSDTTYRVFDWNRRGADGKLRELHIEQALQVINFDDFEPSLAVPNGATLVQSRFFRVERHALTDACEDRCDGSSFHILCGVSGRARIVTGNATAQMAAGDFLLLPATLGMYRVEPEPSSVFLKVFAP